MNTCTSIAMEDYYGEVSTWIITKSIQLLNKIHYIWTCLHCVHQKVLVSQFCAYQVEGNASVNGVGHGNLAHALSTQISRTAKLHQICQPMPDCTQLIDKSVPKLNHNRQGQTNIIHFLGCCDQNYMDTKGGCMQHVMKVQCIM